MLFLLEWASAFKSSYLEALTALNLPPAVYRLFVLLGMGTYGSYSQTWIESLKEIPVLFLTADSDEYTTMSAFDAGASHFITKPIKPAIIAGMIDELLQKKI